MLENQGMSFVAASRLKWVAQLALVVGLLGEAGLWVGTMAALAMNFCVSALRTEAEQ